MFNGRYTFDSMTVAKDSYVFASEYAVFDWGISTMPRGNIQVRVTEKRGRTAYVIQICINPDDSLGSAYVGRTRTTCLPEADMSGEISGGFGRTLPSLSLHISSRDAGSCRS